MTNSGTSLYLSTGRHYEDLTSLKKWLWSTGNQDIKERIITYSQLTDGATEAELESTDAIVITQIGKTELPLVLSGDGDNASTTGKLYTLVYVDNDGASHTAVGTGTATLNGTPVAFVPAVTDFYAVTSFTASAADANVNVIAKVAAGSTYATISTTATAATQAQMTGVGLIYGRAHTDHADGDGKLQYLTYLTLWGAIKYGHCTHAANSETETRFYEATDAGDGTLTATTTTVKDFYRIIRHWTNSAPTVNSHEYLICTDETADVDGSDGDIMACIKELESEGINTRCHARKGYRSWVGKVVLTCPTVAAADSFTCYIHATPLNQDERTIPIIFGGSGAVWSSPFELEPQTDVYFTITDAATAATIGVEITWVEVEQ